jgi:uncharacterized cofD-like protein
MSLTDQEARPTQDALDAIENADVIILGPGSLYTSVIPNLIIKGMTEAIVKSSALKIYVCNVMTQHGETYKYSASDHLKALIEHTSEGIVDICLINNADVSASAEDALIRYKEEKSYPVAPDIEKIKELGCRVVATDLLGVTDYLRHDSGKLNKALIKIIESNRVIKR